MVAKIIKPRHSMRKKLMLLYVPLLLIPLFVFAVISNNLFRQAIVQRSLSSMADNASVMAAQVDGKIEAANSCATYLSLDIDQLYTVAAKNPTIQERLRYEALLANALSYARLIFPEVDSMVFIDTRGKIFTTHAQMITADPNEEAIDYLNPLFASAGNRVWFPAAKRTWLNISPDSHILTLGKKVWHTQTGKTIGYLFLNLNPDNLTQGFRQDLATYHLVSNTTLVFPRDDWEIASKVALQMNESTSRLIEDRLMVKVPLKHLKLSIMGYGDLEAHTPDLRQGSTLLLMAGAMILLVLFLFTWFSQRFILRPVKLLHQGVEAISDGRFSHRLPESQKDELGLLAAHINRMSEKIESLLDTELLMAKRRRELELERLQEQIKPHFLYNTLDIITKLVEMGDLRRAKRAANKLAAFYQRSLADGSEEVTLQQELQLIEDYMAIQNIRYGDAFLLITSIEPNLNPLFIPKLTLQPLVENAIYHGLKLVDRPGVIRIEAKVNSPEDCVIKIYDNGVGLSDENLNLLNRQLVEGEKPSVDPVEASVGFGLSSVAERLKLYYGSKATLLLSQNTEDQDGLVITLTIPKPKEVE